MWVRKRIDISIGDIRFGMLACLRGDRRAELIHSLDSVWEPNQSLPCLSVRSGLELLLSIVDWPKGSEVVMSGMTIPHMTEIVRKNGFVPVGLDLDLNTLSLSADQIRAKITPQTKAIIFAHLFGGLGDLNPVFEVAREHSLMVIEDCAQAYVGSHYFGDDRADISMFSFGAIKTNTSLCGAILVVRRSDLMSRLKHAHEQWPIQSGWTMIKRLFRFSLVKAMSTYCVAGAIAGGLRLIGTDHDRLAVKLSRGFAGGDFFARIRQQPSSALLALMNRRFSHFEDREIVERTLRGQALARTLGNAVHVLGSKMDRQTYWVFAILVNERQHLVSRMWKLGFDATGSNSMSPVDESESQSSQLPNVQFILDHIVFLPFDLRMNSKELDRMAQAILTGVAEMKELPLPFTE